MSTITLINEKLLCYSMRYLMLQWRKWLWKLKLVVNSVSITNYFLLLNILANLPVQLFLLPIAILGAGQINRRAEESSCAITTTILSQEQLENGSFPVSNRINHYERSLAGLCVQKTTTAMLERLWAFIVSCTNASWKMHLLVHLITN